MSDYPKNSRGEVGHYQGGSCFSSSQCEHHQLDGRWAHPDAQIFIVELEDHTWLDDHIVYLHIPQVRFATREEALTSAVKQIIERATMACTEWHHYPVIQGNAIIKWASAIAKLPPPEPIQEPPKPEPKGQLGLFK